MTLAAVITARDAEAILPDLLDSIKDHVDEIVIGVDERTEDKTRELAAARGCRVFDVSLIRDGEMDFAQGRNQTLEKAGLTTDFFIWIDTDDVLVASVPLKRVIEEAQAARPSVESIWLPYLYSRDQYGKVQMRHYRERIIKVSAHPKWMSRLHETCHTDSGPKEIWAEANLDYDKARVWVDHKNRKLTEAGKWDRNFPILMKMVEEDPKDYRAVREVAEAYFASTQWGQAVEWYEKFLDLTAASTGTPLEERWLAVVYKGRAERMSGRVRESMRTADRALLMCPQFADSYFELMYGYVIEGHWPKAIYWFDEGMKRGRPDGILQTSPYDYECAPYRAIHAAYSAAGDLPKAVDAVEKALSYLPDDDDLLKARLAYTHLYNRRSVVESAIENAKFLAMTNEVLKAKAVIDNVPAGAGEEFPEIAKVKAEIDARLEPIKSLSHMRTASVAEPLVDIADPSTDADWLKRVLNGRVLWFGLERPADVFAQTVQIVGCDVDPRKVARANYAAVDRGLLKLVDAPDYSEPEGPVTQLPETSTRNDLRPDLPVQFHVSDIEKPYPLIRDLGPYDAVVLNGVLERAIDVDKALEVAESLAPLVVILTPDGTAPNEERPGVVRAWSQKELESMFWTRGQTVESNYGFAYRPKVDISERMPVVIYCGPGLEQWTPDQVDREGLGGSETAVVYLAKELVSRGFRVMVYAEAEGIWDGVFYRHHSKFVPENPVGIFVAWRNPSLVDLPLEAERKYLWLHDVDSGDMLTEERAAKFDGLLILSEWHKKHLQEKYPFIAEDKYAIIGNGIDPSRFDWTWQFGGDPLNWPIRDPHRFVYVSSPDRGLERALVMWPFIRKEYPEATLHVFYGWENYDRLGRDPAFKFWIQDKAKAEGIEWHGRIGQRELARELMKSGGLFYPGPHGFEETFCISAIEAQAAGCVPVTRNNGALPETNFGGITLSTRYATVNDYTAALKQSSEWTNGQRAAMSYIANMVTWGVVTERFLDFVRASYKEAVAA